MAFGTVIYNLSGTYSASAPDTELLTPGVPFSATFSVAEPAIPYNFSSNQTNLSVGLTYVLNGSTLATYSPGVTLWTTAAGGGLSLIFWESNGINRIRLDMHGPQMFTGPTSAPVLLPSVSIANQGTWSYQNLTSIITAGQYSNGSLSSTPEPATGALIACGLGLCWIGRRRINS